MISVALDLWVWEAMPRRTEAERAVSDAIKQLEPIRQYLAEMAEKTR